MLNDNIYRCGSKIMPNAGVGYRFIPYRGYYSYYYRYGSNKLEITQTGKYTLYF